MGEVLLSPSYGLSKNQLKKTTATVADVISGKKFYDSNGNLATGTLVDLGYEPEAKGGMMYENSLYVFVGENAGQNRWALTRGVRMSQGNAANVIGLNSGKLVAGQSCLGISGTGGKVFRESGWVTQVRDDPNLKGRPFKVRVQTNGNNSPSITLAFDNGTNISV